MFYSLHNDTGLYMLTVLFTNQYLIDNFDIGIKIEIQYCTYTCVWNISQH